MDDAPFTNDATLLYGIVDGTATDQFAPVCEQTGVQKHDVTLVRCGPLAVFASPVSDVEALHSPDVRIALAHKSVVDTAFERGTVLPLRFGTYVTSRTELNDALQAQQQRYRIQLDRLNGYAEMGIRLTFSLPKATSSSPGLPSDDASYRSDRPGTAYLLARQRERSDVEQKAYRIVRAFQDKLTTLTADSSFAADPEMTDGASVAFLVARSQTDSFREAALDLSVPGVASTEVVGPWAPYSFV